MGPTCKILLKNPLTDTQLLEIAFYVAEKGEIQEDLRLQAWSFLVKLNQIIPRDFSDKGCVFSIYVWEGLIAEYGGSYEIEENELKQLEQVIGFRPHGHIQLDASCNGVIDHALLGKMASDLLNKFGGFIDFGGILNLNPNESVPGKLINIGIENEEHYYQLGDQIFLDYWLNHNQFRMIK